ncbi:hypothetical protein KKG71_02105 [Patescibacteria group bacterium]|nr:hypothetical protein [Patescibacteria group bacterium]
MNTQISFTADTSLKKRAMEKAKEKGITLKSLFVFSMEAFVEDKISLGIVTHTNEVEEIQFKDSSINKKAEKLASLLK